MGAGGCSEGLSATSIYLCTEIHLEITHSHAQANRRASSSLDAHCSTAHKDITGMSAGMGVRRAERGERLLARTQSMN